MNGFFVLSGYAFWGLITYAVLYGMFQFAKSTIKHVTMFRSLHTVIYEREREVSHLKDALEEINRHLLNEQSDYLAMHRRAQKFESKAAFWKRAFERESNKHGYFVSVVLDAHDMLPKEITGDTLDLVGNLKKYMALHDDTTKQP